MSAIEMVCIQPNALEGLLGGHAGNLTFDEELTHLSLYVHVESTDQFIFAGKVVINYASTCGGTLGNERHGSIVKTPFSHKFEHSLQNRFALVLRCRHWI